MASTAERFRCISAVLNCFHEKVMTSQLVTVVMERKCHVCCMFVVVCITVNVGMLASVFRRTAKLPQMWHQGLEVDSN